MKQNLEISKKRLTYIFTIIVFGIILLIGLIFFTGKYFREVSIQNRDFIEVITNYEKKSFDLYTIIKYINSDFIIKDRLPSIKDKVHPPHGKMRDFIILDRENKVIYSDVKEKISNNLLQEILFNTTYHKNIHKNGFLIRKIKLSDNTGTIIFIKKMHYSLFDYLLDIFGFLLLNLIFSIVLYYISYKLINKVFVPVEQNIKDMNDFIQNVGHELKTPLAVIDSNIQIVNDMEKYDKEMILEIKNEVLVVNSIIDSLIKLTNINSNSKISKINIFEIISLILKEYEAKIKDKKIDIELSLDKKIEIYSNREYLHIFLSNIIGNAIKYNKNGGGILIQGDNNKIIIKDSGVGISKDSINKIFDRFYQEDTSRKSEGFGIGLSLVKKISDMYGWKINIKSEKNNGTEFIINFIK